MKPNPSSYIKLGLPCVRGEIYFSTVLLCVSAISVRILITRSLQGFAMNEQVYYYIIQAGSEYYSE